MEITGAISGTGQEMTRYNEITAEVTAAVREIIVGYQYGIIKDETGKAFKCEKTNKSKIKVFGGMAFAYGYYGMIADVEISFFNPPVTQYHMVYLEWNKSVLPNVFSVKTKNNYASPQIFHTTFRRDVLSFMKTGVFQLPVAIIAIGKNGIQQITDLRQSDMLYPVYNTPLLTPYPYKMENADEATNTEINGILENGIETEWIDAGDDSTLVASTYSTKREVYKNINL